MIGNQPLSWDDYEAAVYDGALIELSPANRVTKHRDELEHQVEAGAVIYAVNTGYGASADVAVPPESIARVQANTLARTHRGSASRHQSTSCAASCWSKLRATRRDQRECARSSSKN